MDQFMLMRLDAVLASGLQKVSFGLPDHNRIAGKEKEVMNYRSMASFMERAMPRFIFLVLYGTIAVLKTSCSFYFRYGFLESAYLWKSRDRSGSPVSLFSYPALEYPQGLDISGMSVFEFGLVHSTHYWSNLARSVFLVEDNAERADRREHCLEQILCVSGKQHRFLNMPIRSINQDR